MSLGVFFRHDRRLYADISRRIYRMIQRFSFECHSFLFLSPFSNLVIIRFYVQSPVFLFRARTMPVLIGLFATLV